MATHFPSGTVTFLFTDVEGSTKLLHALGAEAYAAALAEHRRLLRDAFVAHGGVEVDTQGDAFFIAFPTAPGALAAAREATAALADGPIRVRIGLHTGTPLVTDEGYVGPDVHRAARIAAAGHGGQVLVSAASAALLDADGTALRDLGAHRLKDLTATERIYQLGEAAFPPLKTLHQTNLPVPATVFLGRATELAELAALLTRDDVRLVTLTGPGGTGKTRLALQATASAADAFPGGVWWVPLAPLRDPALVLPSTAAVLGASGDLADHIADTRLLLLLDNFEHLTAAAADLAPLLAACPNLTMLVTSREPLRLAGEHEYAVDPLTPPEAVELFMTRALAAKRDFTATGEVAAICERLDRLPLAIELAAARIKLFSPAALLERLDQRLPLLAGGARDLPEHQRTLRATIEWSHELLTADEQRLFRRLAVFRGGCTFEAGEAVADAGVDTLQGLVDKSLVRVRDGDRFWMLETIREFAVERLDASDEAEAVRDRHADHVAALAEMAYAERHTAEARWSAVLRAEADNIRAALDVLARRDPRGFAALAGAIAPYWHLFGLGPEAARHLVGALGRHADRDAVRARALTHAALLLHITNQAGSSDDARHTAAEALAIWRDLGDERGEALALENRGFLHLTVSDYGAARRDFEESLALREHAGAPLLEAQASASALCQLLVAGGDAAAAEPLAQRLYELGLEHDAVTIRGDALHFLADCPLLTGDYAEAERRYRRALGHAWEHGMALQAANELLGTAMSAAGQHDPARAVRLAEAAYEQRVRLGVRRLSPMGFWRDLQDRFIGSAREQLSAADLEDAERAGREAPFEAVIDEVLADAAG